MSEVWFDAAPGLFEFLGHYRPPHPTTVPDHIRASPEVFHALIVAAPGPYMTRRAHILGLGVTPDHTLEPGAWQVYTADNTLIRDSRSTNTPTGSTP